jgi:urease accessory protein
LRFVATPLRTTLAERSHHGPLCVQRPFYPEDGVCHVYVVHPPGGVVGGDRLAIELLAAPSAQALVTTPAAGKFYRSAGAEARQTVDIRIADGASLEWLPQETIYYPGARVRQRTAVHLDGADARFIGWEVACLGLAARGERFDTGLLRQGFEVWRGARPLLLDQLRIEGGGAMLDAACGFAGARVLGTLVASPATAADVAALRDTEAGAAANIGITLVDGVLVARCVDQHGDAVLRRFVALWQALRPRLLQRAAVLPRIWAT